METLTKIREVSSNYEAKIQLLSKKQIKKQKNVNTELSSLVNGKIIVITLINTFEKQMYFLEQLNILIKPINMYINTILVNNIYITLSNIQSLYVLHKNKIIPQLINYNIIYFYQILKYNQIIISKKIQNLYAVSSNKIIGSIVKHIN